MTTFVSIYITHIHVFKSLSPTKQFNTNFHEARFGSNHHITTRKSLYLCKPVLDSGGFGVVYKGMISRTNVAVKKLIEESIDFITLF